MDRSLVKVVALGMLSAVIGVVFGTVLFSTYSLINHAVYRSPAFVGGPRSSEAVINGLKGLSMVMLTVSSLVSVAVVYPLARRWRAPVLVSIVAAVILMVPVVAVGLLVYSLGNYCDMRESFPIPGLDGCSDN